MYLVKLVHPADLEHLSRYGFVELIPFNRWRCVAVYSCWFRSGRWQIRLFHPVDLELVGVLT